MDQKCNSLYFIDCRSYYDLAIQFIIFICIILLIWNVLKDYLNIKNDREPNSHSEYQKSLRRKMRLKQVQIIYLTTYFLSTLFSIVLFMPYMMEGIDFIKKNHLDRVYRISQIIFINALNSLNLTVGLLYWKAMRGYYVLSNLRVPLLMHSFMKTIFFCLYTFNLSPIIASFIWISTTYIRTESLNILTLISTTLSIINCIGCRFTYRKLILTKVELEQRVIKKQVICSILIFASSGLRIIIYLIQIIFEKQWVELGRKFNDECQDTLPIHAIILVTIGLLINLLPSAVYSYLFMSEAKVHRSYLLEQQGSITYS